MHSVVFWVKFSMTGDSGFLSQMEQKTFVFLQGSMQVMETIQPPIQWAQAVAYSGFFFGGVQQIQLKTEDKEDGDLMAVAP